MVFHLQKNAAQSAEGSKWPKLVELRKLMESRGTDAALKVSNFFN